MSLAEATTDTIDWIASGIVAAMVIRVSDRTDSLVTIGLAIVLVLIVGVALNLGMSGIQNLADETERD